MTALNRVSVIVCTFNRSHLLAEMLQSAAELAAPTSWELLIVDNNSSDQTQKVAAGFKQRLPIRYIFESRQGQSIALNRGILESEGDLLLFCDDDVRLEPDWLLNYAKAAKEDPRPGWFGGRVLALWPNAKPTWLWNESIPALSGHIVNYDLGADCRLYDSKDKIPIGASMGLRRSTIEKIGLYREDLGPRGDRRGAGGDTDLIERAINSGIPGYYVGSAVCYHWVHPDRLKVRSFFDYGVSKGFNQYLSGADEFRPCSFSRIADQLVRSVPQVLKNRGDRARICLVNIGIEIGRLKARQAKSQNAAAKKSL